MMFPVHLPFYKRVDAGIYRTMANPKVRWRWSLISRIYLGFTNEGYHYFDPFLQRVEHRSSLESFLFFHSGILVSQEILDENPKGLLFLARYKTKTNYGRQNEINCCASDPDRLVIALVMNQSDKGPNTSFYLRQMLGLTVLGLVGLVTRHDSNPFLSTIVSVIRIDPVDP
jgi:hypothetical protein